MENRRPNPEFGKRRPEPRPSPAAPAKRSGHVALLMMGTIAVGTTAYGLHSRQTCDPASPGAPATAQVSTSCSSRTWSGSSSGWSSRSSFYGSDTAARSSPGGGGEAGTGGVTRGGFGSFAHAFGFSGSG